MALIDVDINIKDYLYEVSTDDLIEELSGRGDLPKAWKNLKHLNIENDNSVYILSEFSKTPIKDLIIDVLDLHVSPTLEDIIERMTEIYIKGK